MTESKGWYRREDGAICYGAECFTLAVAPDGATEVTFDASCEVPEAEAADRAMMQAAASGEGEFRYRKRRVPRG